MPEHDFLGELVVFTKSFLANCQILQKSRLDLRSCEHGGKRYNKSMGQERPWPK